MDHSLRDKANELTARSELLHKKGKFLEAIQLLEEVQSIKLNALGHSHPETERAGERLCQLLNVAAMALLQRNQRLELSLELLKKAENQAISSQLRAVTLNNLGCYYRKTGKLRSAYGFLAQALSTELRGKDQRTLADTHLNLCAVLSELDRHEDSIKHAMLAIIFLQEQFLKVAMPAAVSSIAEERLSVLAIAYHNLGVQFQHIKRHEEAVKIYTKAKTFAETYIPENDQLIANLTRVLNSAVEQLQDIKQPRKTSEKRPVPPPTSYLARADLPRVQVKQSADFDKTRSGRSFFKRRPVAVEGRQRQRANDLGTSGYN